MGKHTKEFKLKIVQEYLEGVLGYRRLAQKYKVPDKSQIRRWVRAYKEFGEEGLINSTTPKNYPVQFKLDVLKYRRETGASYADTATTFKIKNSTMIAGWNRTFEEKGVEGLLPKSRGRSSMSKKSKKNQIKNNEDNTMSKVKMLEEENELLRLENAYLKKLKAFRENPDAYLEKHKQRWHSNLNRRDSN